MSAETSPTAPPDRPKIRRALISVFDKTGVVEFARALHDEFGVELISTGGTAKTLKDAGLAVTLVEEITGFPEMLDGRVKTLHPRIHAAILADRDNPDHMRQLAEQGIEPIDMVVVNLYPFEQTIAKPGCTFEEAIEMIDIGGPCLLRAAAKNHKHVMVISDVADLSFIISQMRKPTVTNPDALRDWRRERAFYAYWMTARYDADISRWLGQQMGYYRVRAETIRLLSDLPPLRYGENPHQSARMLEYDDPRPLHEVTKAASFELTQLSNILVPDGAGPLSACEALPLSFNNFVDASAALDLCAELTRASSRSVLGDRPPAGQTGQRPVPQPPPHPTAPGRPTSSGGPTSGRSSGRSMRSATTDEHFSRRHLPHIERPEAVYFITFRVRAGTLAPEEREIVLSACQFWHARKMTLHSAAVMPDHVHMLITPYEPRTGRWVPLGELLKSVKSYSSSQVNKLRNASGPLWLDENFDRVIRDERDFIEKWDYIFHNPVTAGLVKRPEDYAWSYQSGVGFGDYADERLDRPEVGPPDSTPADRPEVGPPTALMQLRPSVCFIKHTNACGVAVDADAIEAYRRAYLGDPNAAMGGILAVNFNVTPDFATAVMETYQRWGKPLKDTGAAYAPGAFFVEVWLAPSFDDEAVDVIRTKKDWGQRVRLLAVGDMSTPPDPNEMDFKRIAGGMLVQTRDLIGLNEEQWKVVTERAPTESEISDLRLAWLICKHTKSNAITICKDGTLLGNGAGQMSRVMSCRIAMWLAQENGHADALVGAVAASDAFFPFPDGPSILMGAGVTALIQPGGSKRDQEVIAACNARGIAMVFTGTRHFKH